jgi:DNA primase
VRPDPTNQLTDLRMLCAVTTAGVEVFTAPPRRAAARTYLRQRGISPELLPADWPLGYAPPGWTRLVDTLRGEFGDQALLDAGLARISSRGSLIDTFRERVIFPVYHAPTDGRDQPLDSQVGGFIGRDLSGHPAAPKYFNSRHSSLYVKSELLYGLHEGMAAGARPAQIVAVEGPLDVLAIAARAARDQRIDILPVAGSGTAFTANHARQVVTVAGQFGARVVVALDADAPGRAAALMAGNLLHLAGADVRVAALPIGTDPASYLAQPESTLDTFTGNSAAPLLTVQVENAIAAQGDRMQWIEGRLAAARTIARMLTTYPVNHAAGQIGWIAHTLHMNPSTFTDELLEAFRSTKLINRTDLQQVSSLDHQPMSL